MSVVHETKDLNLDRSVSLPRNWEVPRDDII